MKINVIIMSLCLYACTATAQNEPASQPTNLNFSNIKTYKASMSFSPVADANGYLVVLSKNQVNFIPADNTAYQTGEIINGNRIVKSNASTFFFVKNLLQNNSYQIAIFAYNQSGSNINYNANNPLQGTFTTASDIYGGYYNGIDVNASNVVNQFTNLIQPHTQILYSQFDETIIADFFEQDTVIGGNTQHYVECQYSGEKRLYTGTFAFVSPAPQYNREHRAPFTWINFENINRNDFETIDEGCDVHALELTNGAVNSARSNYPFGNVDGNPWNDSYLMFKKGRDTNNNIVAEPRPDRKGDIARAVMYMMLAYNGQYGQNWGMDNLLSEAASQDMQVLVDWHFADLPDDFEKTRHSYVYEKQGNRNPLIDFPELVNCIDFSDMTKKATCNVVISGLKPNVKTEMGAYVYPNPAIDVLYFKDIKGKDIKTIHIYNMLGAEVYNFSYNEDSVNVHNLTKGAYMISIESKNKQYLSKFLLK